MSLITGAGFSDGREMAKIFAHEASSLLRADRDVSTAGSEAPEIEADEGPARARRLAPVSPARPSQPTAAIRQADR